MPQPETSHRFQDAVLWPREGYTDYGEPVLGLPVELRVRWENARRGSLDPQGQTIAIDATVVVDRTVAVDSLMWLGTLEDWYATGSSGQDNGLSQVVAFSAIPDLKGRVIRRLCYLRRYKDSLPSS